MRMEEEGRGRKSPRRHAARWSRTAHDWKIELSYLRICLLNARSQALLICISFLQNAPLAQLIACSLILSIKSFDFPSSRWTIAWCADEASTETVMTKGHRGIAGFQAILLRYATSNSRLLRQWETSRGRSSFPSFMSARNESSLDFLGGSNAQCPRCWLVGEDLVWFDLVF